MSKLANITGASWPTSGAASAASTGFNTVSAGWTHAGSADVPPGTSATGYLRTADNAGGSLRIDAATVPFAGAETDHWVRFWVRAARTAAALPADQTLAFTMSGVGASYWRFWWYVRSGTNADGLTPTLFEFVTGGASRAIDNLGFSAAQAPIPFDEWVEVSLHHKRGPGDGVMEAFVNGVPVLEHTGLTVDGTTYPLANHQADWTVALAATSGIRWEVGPAESWSGTDIAVAPRWDLVDADAPTAKAFMVRFADKAKGGAWDTSGTAVATPTLYSGGGVNPYRYRLVVSGSAGQSKTIATRENLGTLPYNDQGWATLNLMQLYLPGTATATVALRNAGDTADLMSLTIESGAVKQGATTRAPWAHAQRYCLLLHLSDAGQAKLTLVDLTNAGGSQYVWSAALGDWTPAEAGKFRVTVTLGASSCEVDGLLAQRWWHTPACDSLTSASANGVTPAMATANNVATYLPNAREVELLPGGNHAGKANGAPAMHLWPIVGRSGFTRASVTDFAIANMAHTRGLRLAFVDGGSINDVNGINASDPAAKVAEMLADSEAACDALLPNGNRIWFSTMVDRVQGTSYTAQERAGIAAINAAWRSMVVREQRGGLIAFSDVEASLSSAERASMFTAGDDTHFDQDGNALYARRMVSQVVTPAGSSPSVAALAGAFGFGFGY